MRWRRAWIPATAAPAALAAMLWFLCSPRVHARLLTLAEGVRERPFPLVSTAGTAPLPPAGLRPEGAAPVSAATPAPVTARSGAPTTHAPPAPRPESPMAHTPVAPRPAADGVAPPGPPARLDDPPSALVPRGEGGPDDLALSPPPKSSGDKDAVNALAALNRLFGNDPAWHRFLMQRMGIDQGVQVFMVREVSSATASGAPAIQPFDFTIPGGTGGRVTFDGSTSTATPGTGGHPLRVEVGTGDNPVVRITEELGPNATRRWTIGPDGNPTGNGVQQVTLNAGTGTPLEITLRLDGAGAPALVTGTRGGGVTTGHVSLLPGGAELRVNGPTGFALYSPDTGALTGTARQLTGGGFAGGDRFALTRPAEGGLTVVDGRLGRLGSGHHPGGDPTVLHLRADGDTRFQVYREDGSFSHETLRLSGTGDLPGGYVRFDGGAPALADARGTVVPVPGGATVAPSVTPMPGGGFRVHAGDHHLVVGTDGARTHTVLPVRGDHLHIDAGNANLATLHRPDGTAVPNTAVTRVDGHWHVTDTTTGDFTRYTGTGRRFPGPRR
ncbi:hypothetical protein [Streptomyces alkaliphilus]|uniref:hypothetical protein n=1 Tax=Streptomyces alkaliphilus TaxID=1472722 RepID=UPI001180DDEF|nr:hypothetical protein [Streptomyces alkaliphilus]MQS09380.1 hypothetical protein [Streptomyces alkaliphilus]